MIKMQVLTIYLKGKKSRKFRIINGHGNNTVNKHVIGFSYSIIMEL